MRKPSQYCDLLKQMETLQKQIDAVRAEERGAALAQCLALIADYELTKFELFSKVQQIKAVKVKPSERTFPVKVTNGKVPPKYQNPETGATWSGRGTQPRWMTGPREDYLIDVTQRSQAPLEPSDLGTAALSARRSDPF